MTALEPDADPARPTTAGFRDQRAAGDLLEAWLWDDLPADHPAG